MEQDRRRIEREFFEGKLLGVAATNALELGIDVGHIDVTLHLGFPGSISRYSVCKFCFLFLCSHSTKLIPLLACGSKLEELGEGKNHH